MTDQYPVATGAVSAADRRAKFRALLSRPGIIIQPSVGDPLSACVAESLGFEAIALGGYALGARFATTEPLLSIDDVAATVRNVSLACGLPVMVDAGAGWGDPLNVMHTVRVLELSGAASMHIEDQSFPKRAHYHRGTESVIPQAQMVAKVKAAVGARQDSQLVVIARTDAMRTGGYEDGIRRAEAYAQAGAEMIMLFPNSLEEAERAPQDLPGVPLVYVNSTGNRFNRPVIPAQQLEEYGWKLVYDSFAATGAMVIGLRSMLATLRATGVSGLEATQMIAVRNFVEEVIGLDRLYAVEEQAPAGAD